MIDRWTIRTAWRDSRGSRRRLLLYLSSMTLGIAALVAIESFGVNLRRAVDAEALALMGADLSLERNSPFPDDVEALIDSLGGEQSRRVSFASMAYFPASGGTRLATVRADSGAFPFYGETVTEPPGAADTYREAGQALVDGSLLDQFGAGAGDSVRIGTRTYAIAGRVVKTSRENAAASLFSPRIYLPRADLDTTLLTLGSRASYEVFFRFDDGRDVEAMVDSMEARLRAADVRFDTVQEVREDWTTGLGNLYRFLGLIGFVALLLGGLGVGSAVHVYVRGRVETVAVLRCLGARAWRTFGVYLVQALALGLVGAALGIALGLGVQLLLPRVLADFLPITVDFRIAWGAVALSAAVGVGVTLLFALLPLLAVRRVSPLAAIRRDYQPEDEGRDPARWAVYAALALGIVGFAVAQAPTPVIGLGFAAGIGAVFGALALVARAVIAGARRLIPARWPYVWRQGLANLYRPRNQTLVLVLVLGFGAFLVLTLVLVQRTLLAQVEFAGQASRPDNILFDIQPDQRAGVRDVIDAEGLTLIDMVPVVPMRLEAVGDRTIDAMRADSADLSWAHRREYRSTYRDALTESERVVEGAFDLAEWDGSGLAPVSVEIDLATELGVGVGDTLVWDVQGVAVPTRITSLRRVEWRRVQTNFFVVFPPSVLEPAPQFYVALTRAGSPEATAALQRALVERYPNVSAVDLNLIVSVVESLSERVALVVRFMALFSILTGLLVLAGAVVVSRFQRLQESVLLKTLGASRRQVLTITVAEYGLLGLLASLTALVLAFAAAWALARWVFEAPLAVPVLAVVATAAGVVVLTAAIGLLNSRGIYDRPALAVLRAE